MCGKYAKDHFCDKIKDLNKRLGNIPIIHDVLYLGMLKHIHNINQVTPSNYEMLLKILRKRRLDEWFNEHGYEDCNSSIVHLMRDLLSVPKTWNQAFEESKILKLENKNTMGKV